MLTTAYREALVELLEILKYASDEELNKIPKKLMIFFKENASPTYKFVLNEKKEIKDLKLKKETKGLLAMIYRNYWCTPEERKDYDAILVKNQKLFDEALREKYNPDKIFEKPQVYSETTSTISDNTAESSNKETSLEESEKHLVAYNNNIFSNILEKIRMFFKKFAHSN